jgi:hypothetical protein
MVNETEEPRMSVLDETKAAIEELKKEKAESVRVKEELERLRSDQLLSGTAGARVEPTPPREETAKEYAERIEKGNFNKQ